MYYIYVYFGNYTHSNHFSLATYQTHKKLIFILTALLKTVYQTPLLLPLTAVSKAILLTAVSKAILLTAQQCQTKPLSAEPRKKNLSFLKPQNSWSYLLLVLGICIIVGV